MLTNSQLAEIKRLDAERTQGAWRTLLARWSPDGGWTDLLCDINGVEGLVLAEVQNHKQISDRQFTPSTANADWIAACSWAVPALIAEVERLQSERNEMQHELDGFRFWHGGMFSR